MATFKQLNLKPSILEAISKIGFKQMTSVQSKTIPLSLQNKNLIAQSQTGSGKTHSFLIPLFNNFEKAKNIGAIIVLPTRELARQVFQEAQNFNKLAKTELNIKLVIGGSDKKQELSKYQKLIPNIIIGTPGRIEDLFVKSNSFSLQNVTTFIIDEADMIFDMGFADEINSISSKVKKAQFKLYSATIPVVLKHYIKKNLKAITIVDIKPDLDSPKNISHFLINTRHKEKIKILTTLLKQKKDSLSIVFVNKQKDVGVVVNKIKEFSKSTIALHGGLSSRSRKNAIKAIKDNKFNIIVATDIAARGIDIKGVENIYSLDFPYEYQYYIHRSGRTGRAKQKGNSYLFYDNDDQKKIDKLTSFNISFTYCKWVNNEVVKIKKRNFKFGSKVKTDEDKEILALISQRKSKIKRKGVKPGYRKKLKAEIKEIKRKKVKAAIKSSIKKIKKEKAKEKQTMLKLVNK